MVHEVEALYLKRGRPELYEKRAIFENSGLIRENLIISKLAYFFARYMCESNGKVTEKRAFSGCVISFNKGYFLTCQHAQ